ncbi:MAG: hypothetical protein H6739_17665 [Alphaproteobacteria bacterium]|nr:hypothetical protein [Alphaproteobacteria bacterium]
MFINDRAAHRVGDTVLCGSQGALVSGSPNVIIGQRGGQAVHGGSAAPLGPAYDGGFILHYEGTDEPVPYRRYRITRANGDVFEGRTNALGRTVVIASDEQEDLRIEVFDDDDDEADEE